MDKIPSITITDLGMAYRKAKVDLFYSSHASLSAIADYEENLINNLKSLRDKINGSDELWINDSAFIGGWCLIPKGISDKPIRNGMIYASPHDNWKCLRHNESKKIKAEFRLMAQNSIDFHVLSTLWMSKIGHKYDATLSESACGNRLRRKQSGELNSLSLGSFAPYLNPFRSWRDNGLQAMRKALDGGKKVVAITADVTSFYHELNPNFMMDKKFLNVIGIKPKGITNKINRLFINALKNWSAATPLKKGLPVGLPASAIVANMALVELDRIIKQEVCPLYYGRYVDDIILVMENGSDFNSTDKVWEWLFARSKNILSWNDSIKKDAIIYAPEYLKDSSIRFSNNKNKVFLLEGSYGQTLIDSLSREIHDRSSEWRALPALPKSSIHVATDLVSATQSDGETADNLRKADALTMRRAGFALKLRDFEAYERDLPPDTWSDHRHAFFRAFIQHVLVLPSFFDLAIYLPRVIRMATACEDFEFLWQIIEALNKIEEEVKESCKLNIKSCDKNPADKVIYNKWREKNNQIIDESIKAAFPLRLTKKGTQSWNKFIVEQFDRFVLDCSVKTMQAEQARFFAYDLSHIPFRYIGLPRELIAHRKIPSKKSIFYCKQSKKIVQSAIFQGVSILAKWLKLTKSTDIPNSIIFPTRPFNLTELFFLKSDPYESVASAEISKIILALRGFTTTHKMPIRGKNGDLLIQNGIADNKKNIALASWKTDERSWRASVANKPDSDLNRYQRITHLLNQLLSHPQHASYLVMPELSIPARWFLRIAQKLQGRGISLIAGVEYQHRKKGIVNNQVWAALSHDGLGFPSMAVVKQDKQRPALHEEYELNRLAGLKLQPETRWKTPPVIRHGEFHFAILVCSELTNINYRSALRGKIDALFVPEWNQDTETFNALVESASLDIHAYIIQCNDRQYGDSRIRAPYKDSWKRDLVRIRGGRNDFFVIGEINIAELRAFQSAHRSPSEPFKPVPDGFKICFERKQLPSGDTHE